MGPHHPTPVHDLFAQPVFSARGADVEDVVIEGRPVTKDRALLTLDEGAVLAEARSLALHIRERLREHPDTASLVLGAPRPGARGGASRPRPGGAR